MGGEIENGLGIPLSLVVIYKTGLVFCQNTVEYDT